MEKMKTTLFFAFLWMSQLVWAQNISVQVSADRVGVGESFLVNYTLEGDVEDFTLPEFRDFKVFQSGKSTNMSIINGKITKSVGYNITVVPLSVGIFEIAPAKAVINGKKVSSPSFTIEVIGNNTDPRTQQQNKNQKIDAPTDDWRENILLLAEVDKKQIYVGEQVTVTYKLLRRLDFQSMEVEKMPVFKGFLSEEMEIPPQQSEGVMDYNGKKYYFQAFRKVALFGAQSGKQAIDPLVARGVILIPERDPFFGTTIFSTTVPKMVVFSSNTLNIEVLSLPITNQPSNFSGAVGQFQAQRIVNNIQPMQGEATTVKIDVNGWGNLKAIQAIRLKNTTSYELFEPEINDTPRKNGEIYGGTRSFQYSLVPEKSGEIIIPKEEFVYFDPEQKSYITQDLPEIKLTVGEKTFHQEEMADGQVFVSQIKDQLQDNSNATSNLPIALAVVSGIPFLAFIFGAAWWKRKDASSIQTEKSLLKLSDFKEDSDKNNFSVLAQEFRTSLKDLLQVDASTDDVLLNSITDETLKQRAGFVLHSCDRAAYSPLLSISIIELKSLAEGILLKISESSKS